MTDFNGSTVGYTVNGRTTFEFALPRDRATLPAKVAAALGRADAAVANEQEVRRKDGNDRAAQREANEKVGAAVDDVFDVASSTSRARREHHLEEYAYAAAKLGRAMEEAERALQTMADHAQMAVCPAGVGFSREASKGSPVVTKLRFLSDQMGALASVPALEGEV
jgi:hypothetical protein